MEDASLAEPESDMRCPVALVLAVRDQVAAAKVGLGHRRPGLLLLIGVSAFFYTPSGTERLGNFEIAYSTIDMFGHRSTRKAVSHLTGGRRAQVVKSAGGLAIVPSDPDRLVYENCDSEIKTAHATDGCVHMYYDGHSGVNRVVAAGLRLSLSPLSGAGTMTTIDPWSPNGSYVVIGDDAELILLDLNSGVAMRLTEALELRPPHYPEQWEHRVGRFAGWSPEGTEAAVIVGSPRGPELPALDWREQLYRLEAARPAR